MRSILAACFNVPIRLKKPKRNATDIEVIGQYEIAWEAYPDLSSAQWTSMDLVWTSCLTIYQGHAASYKSVRLLERQKVVSETPVRSREQAIEMARFHAARKIARGKF